MVFRHLRFVLSLFSMLAPLSASAEDQPAAELRPWAEGVSAEAQAQATALFLEGNSAFEQGKYAMALAQYLKAKELWPHPAIEFNAAICYSNLDKPFEAYALLERSRRFGSAPLGPKLYSASQAQIDELERRLARLTVKCTQSARISLDGEEILNCPGEVTRLIRPGRHELVGREPGFATIVKGVDFAAGTTVSESLSFVSLAESFRLTRRFSPWVPLAVAAPGAATGLLGLGLNLAANAGTREYDREVARLCPMGCAQDDLPRSVSSQRSQAETLGVAALVSYGLGAAALVTGAILFIINVPSRVLVDEVRVGAPQLSLNEYLRFDPVTLTVTW